MCLNYYTLHKKRKEGTLPHLVLLGDSIFDNAHYVGKDLDVLAHLRRYLPHDWQATLLAIDGSTSQELFRQVQNIPTDATHLILSSGGNDAIREQPILQESARTNLDAILQLADLAEEFRRSYHRAVGWLSETGLPLALCTIYHPIFPEPDFQKVAETVLAVFNDIIITEAVQSGLPVLDLRAVCSEVKDFSDTIEPSEIGGKKIALAVAAMFREHRFGKGKTAIFI